MVWPDCEALTIIKSRMWRDFCLNLQGQGHRQRSRWKELTKVYLHLMCEKVIDHGLGTMKINVNYTFDLETWNLQGQGRRQRSRRKELIKVYLYLMCERVIDHGLDTMKLYVNYIFDLETSNIQGQGHRQRSRWKRTHQGLSTSDVWKSY